MESQPENAKVQTEGLQGADVHAKLSSNPYERYREKNGKALDIFPSKGIPETFSVLMDVLSQLEKQKEGDFHVYIG